MNEGLTKSYSNQFCATSYPFLYTGRNQDIMKSSKATCSFSSHVEHAFFLLLFKRLKITPTKYEGFTRENHFWVTTAFPVSQCDHDCPFLFGFICKLSDEYSGLKMEKWRLPSNKSSYLRCWNASCELLVWRRARASVSFPTRIGFYDNPNYFREFFVHRR